MTKTLLKPENRIVLIGIRGETYQALFLHFHDQSPLIILSVGIIL